MKKHFFWSMVGLVLTAFLSASLSACSSDDSNDGNDGGSSAGAIDMTKVVGRSFYKTQGRYGVDSEEKTYELEFHNTKFVHVHVYGRGFASDEGNYRYDLGESDCTFTISGNLMVIDVRTNKNYQETLRITFQNNSPVGWDEGARVTIDDIGSDDSSTAGTSAMVGYYSCAYPNAHNDFVGLVDSGNGIESWWNDVANRYRNLLSIRIVDGSTIYLLRDFIFLNEDPHDSDPELFAYKTESFYVDRTSYKVYYWMDPDPRDILKYVVQGNKIVTTGTQVHYEMEYRNGSIFLSGTEYVKVK